MLEPRWYYPVPGYLLKSGKFRPIFQTTEGWFFHDETEACSFGPMDSEDSCIAEWNRYFDHLQHGPKYVTLWDAINEFAVASGGSSESVSDAKMRAVVEVEKALKAYVEEYAARHKYPAVDAEEME